MRFRPQNLKHKGKKLAKFLVNDFDDFTQQHILIFQIKTTFGALIKTAFRTSKEPLTFFEFLNFKKKSMEFVGFVIAIIIASSAFFTLAALSIGAVTLLKEPKEEEEISLD